MEIKGQVALITGGASGLGAATARRIHGAGGSVLLMDLSEENGRRLAGELGHRAAFVKGDVVDGDQMAAAVDAAVSKFGGLQILVCCAGIGPPARVLGRDGPQPLEKFARIITINLIGTFNAIRLSAAAMSGNTPNAQGERGVIINTASVAAYEGQIGQAAYSASKGGIVGMTLPIAREFAKLGIRVMTIAPGIFDTPLMGSLPEEARASLGAQVPFPPRLGHPDEYAELAAQIIAMPMLNGETIRLDGAIRRAPR